MSIEAITSSQLFAHPTVQKTAAPQTHTQSAETAPRRVYEESQRVNEEIRRVVDELAKVALSFNRRLDFTIFEETNQVVVRVIDQDTNEVIRQVPPEELLKLHARIREAVALLVDETI